MMQRTAEDLQSKFSAILAGVTVLIRKASNNRRSDPVAGWTKSAFDGAVSNFASRRNLRIVRWSALALRLKATFRAENVASDESLAPLVLHPLNTDAVKTAPSESNGGQHNASCQREEFAGDNVSPDLRRDAASGNSPRHAVNAILASNDPNSATLRRQLSQYGGEHRQRNFPRCARGGNANEGDRKTLQQRRLQLLSLIDRRWTWPCRKTTGRRSYVVATRERRLRR